MATAAKTELNWDEVKADFIQWEGSVPYMYLDTRGFVTVGVGKMLPHVAAASALGFVRRADKSKAPPAEIEAEFIAISKQPKAKIAKFYEEFTKLILPDDAIATLLKTVVDGFEADLRKQFAGYDAYPVPAKRALLDMVYNLGMQGLSEYKKLKIAVEKGDWKTAAAESHRNGPGEDRNNWTRDRFLEAAK